MDPVSSFIQLANTIGSFLCFQWEEASYSVNGMYFPVCSGCFGIYLGSLIALSLFPTFKKLSKKLFTLKYGLPMLLPMTIYWATLNIELATGTWIILGIKEVYSLFGVLFGATVLNAAYNLGMETKYGKGIQQVGKKLWILTVILIFLSSAAFSLYSSETAILFTASLIFIFGLFGLVGLVAAWITASILSTIKEKILS